MFRSVCVPHGVSTVHGRGGAAPEAGVHGVAKEVTAQEARGGGKDHAG